MLYQPWPWSLNVNGKSIFFVLLFNELKTILNTEDVAIVIDATHLCVASRGIKDVTSSTVTIEAGGAFKDQEKWSDFISIIGRNKG